MRSYLADILVRSGILDLPAQQAVASHPDLASVLAFNPYIDLDEDVWFKLYSDNVPADVAVGLAGRPLTESQIEHMLAVESRKTPWVHALTFNCLTLDQQTRFAGARKGGSTTKAVLLDCSWVDRDLAKQIALKVGKVPLLKFLATCTPADMPSNEVRAILDKPSFWTPKRVSKKHALLAERIVENYPEHVDAFASEDLPEAFRRRIAGVRHITDVGVQHRLGFLGSNTPFDTWDFDRRQAHSWLLMRLVHNPVVHKEILEAVVEEVPENGVFLDVVYKTKRRLRFFDDNDAPITVPFEKVSNSKTLDYLISRSLPSDLYDRHFPGRGWDLTALAHNPNLTVQQATTVLFGLREADQYSDLGLKGTSAEKAVLAKLGWDEAPKLVDPSADKPFQVPSRPNRQPPSWQTENLESVADTKMSAAYMDRAALFFVNAFAGDKAVQRWQVLLTLLDGFDGTCGELAELCCLATDA